MVGAHARAHHRARGARGAATTPTIWTQAATSVRLEMPLDLAWSAYSGAGSLASVQVAVYAASSGGTALWSSGFVAPGDTWLATRWARIWPAWWDAQAGTTYYVGVTHRNSVPETSSESTRVSVAMESSPLTVAQWGRRSS